MPNYYLVRRLSFNVFFEALAGHLVSPSRGLLLYVPVLLFVGWLLIRYRNAIESRTLLWMALAIILVHLIIICGFDHWWGGFCYGPRLMASLVPWFVLLAILGLSAAQSRLKRTEVIAGLLLLVASMFTNARGAVSRQTWIWNTVPVNVDVAPERLWNWGDPQALAGLLRPPRPRQFPILSGRVELSKPEAEKYLWYGWSGPEPTSRWTDGHEAAFVFTFAGSGKRILMLRLSPYLVEGELNQQRLSVKLNGKQLGELTLTRREPTTHSFVLEPDNLTSENVLSFELPDAIAPAAVEKSDDLRELGVAVSWIELMPSN
jgi:hypothetical protein